MKRTPSWLFFFALFTLCATTPLHAAVEKQPKYELAFGVPQFPRDAQGKPKKAEIIMDLNVPDPANANAMKSFPITIELDPGKFPAFPANPTPANIAKWQHDMAEAKNKAFVAAINADTQIKDNNKALKKANRGGEQTTAVYKEGDVHTYDNAGEVVQKVANGPYLRISNLRYDLTDATPALRCPSFRTKDESKEPGGAAPARIKGGTPTPTPTPSPGSMGGKGGSSMGYEWDGSTPSSVSFGYFNNVDGGSAFVATVYPQPGQTDNEILALLAGELGILGVPAIYDPLENLLTLNVDISPNQTFWFDDTDPGLDFDINLPAFGAFNAPEPTTAMMLLAFGMIGLAQRRRAV